jgi:hypothetical protein
MLSRDGAQQARFPNAVAPEHTGHLASASFQRNTAQHLGGSVFEIYRIHVKHQEWAFSAIDFVGSFTEYDQRLFQRKPCALLVADRNEFLLGKLLSLFDNGPYRRLFPKRTMWR